MAYAFLLIIILICVYGLTQYVSDFMVPLAIGFTSSLLAATVVHYVIAQSPQHS